MRKKYGSKVTKIPFPPRKLFGRTSENVARERRKQLEVSRFKLNWIVVMTTNYQKLKCKEIGLTFEMLYLTDIPSNINTGVFNFAKLSTLQQRIPPAFWRPSESRSIFKFLWKRIFWKHQVRHILMRRMNSTIQVLVEGLCRICECKIIRGGSLQKNAYEKKLLYALSSISSIHTNRVIVKSDPAGFEIWWRTIPFLFILLPGLFFENILYRNIVAHNWLLLV